MRTFGIMLCLTAAWAAGLEAQAVASPASRHLPRSPARGTRTEPPPPPEPGQPAPPAQPVEPTRPNQPPARQVYVGGPAPYYYYSYGAGYGGTYFESEGTYAQQAPPPSQIDVRGPQPGPAMAFIPGFWTWTGSSYNWNEGRWVPIPAGYTQWVPGRWMQNQFGYYNLRGYWER
jgi:hypothetical protein